MKKKYVYIIIPVLLILTVVIFILTIFPQPQKNDNESITPTNNQNSYSPQSFQNTQNQLPASYSLPATPQISAETEHLTPEEVANKFYSWYLTYTGVTALSTGAYKNNQFISDKFKRIISMMAPYNAQNDPVFCTQNKEAKFKTMSPITSGNGRQAVIIQSVPEGKNLYKIILDNVDGRWLVDDTICIP